MARAQADGSISRVGRVRRVLIWALAGELLVLLVTGGYLVLFYRPTAAQAWNDIYGLHDDVTLATSVRTAHRWVSSMAVMTSLVLAGVLVGEGASRWRRSPGARRLVATGPLAAVGIVAAAVTGRMLPWDQLALWAVTVGTDLAGYRPVFGDDQVRFVLIGGSEVSLGTIRTVLMVHAALLPIAVAGLLWASRTRAEADAAPPPPPRGTDRQELVIAATDEDPHTG